jgi:hypothetical protein
MFNDRNGTRFHCVNVCGFSALSVLIGCVTLLVRYGFIAPGNPARLAVVAAGIFWIPYWISAAVRCADAMNALDTTVFVSERLPPIVYGFFVLGLLLGVVYLPGTFSFIVVIIGCVNALSFFACGALVKSDMDGERAGTAMVDAMSALGGVFGVVVARFTFKKSFAINKVAVRVPTILLAIAFLLIMPHALRLVLHQPGFEDLAPPDARTAGEQKLLAPLDGFTGPARPVGLPFPANDGAR